MQKKLYVLSGTISYRIRGSSWNNHKKILNRQRTEKRTGTLIIAPESPVKLLVRNEKELERISKKRVIAVIRKILNKPFLHPGDIVLNLKLVKITKANTTKVKKTAKETRRRNFYYFVH